MFRFLLFVSVILSSSVVYADSEPVIVASIKPLHSLVASVMQGTGAMPKLIVDGSQSPHGFQLKPSHRQALAEADVVFYIDDHFETFLPAALASLKDGALKMDMAKDMPLDLLPERFLGEDKPDAHGKVPTNYHLWLSAANAAAMTQKIAEVLSEKFPGHKEQYMNNARELRVRLQRKDAELSHLLVPAMGKPFIVFHDGYYYFEQRYGLKAVDAITPEPEFPVSGKRLAELRQEVKDKSIRCVFREPQFPSRLVEQIVEGSGARIGLIEPEGATITPGPALYETLLDNLAAAYKRCLAD